MSLALHHHLVSFLPWLRLQVLIFYNSTGTRKCHDNPFFFFFFTGRSTDSGHEWQSFAPKPPEWSPPGQLQKTKKKQPSFFFNFFLFHTGSFFETWRLQIHQKVLFLPFPPSLLARCVTPPSGCVIVLVCCLEPLSECGPPGSPPLPGIK